MLLVSYNVFNITHDASNNIGYSVHYLVVVQTDKVVSVVRVARGSKQLLFFSALY